MTTQSKIYEQLELLPAGSLSGLSCYSPSKVAQGLKTVMGQLLRFFAPSADQPITNIRYSLNGEVPFDAYDSLTQQRQRDSSEEALWLSLEQRRHPK
ncbi:MAG: hypothetical protein AAGG53_12360 [Cyanobacteria bacterium P01_H01_bin.152]